MENIRVLIVDDLPSVRQGLISLLKLASRRTESRIEIAGEAENGQEAIRLNRVLQPDVILMDLEMPILDGYEATCQIKSSSHAPRVVILSIHTGSEDVMRAKHAGADAFIAKGSGYQTLLDAILAKEGSNRSYNQEKGEKNEY